MTYSELNELFIKELISYIRKSITGTFQISMEYEEFYEPLPETLIKWIQKLRTAKTCDIKNIITGFDKLNIKIERL